MQNAETQYVLAAITATQRSALVALISGMEMGRLGTSDIYNAENQYGLKEGSQRKLTHLRFDGKTRQQVASILKADLATLDANVPVSAVTNLVSSDITSEQRVALEGLIVQMKNDDAGSYTVTRNGTATYGLVNGADLKLRTMRTNAPYMTRKQLGYLLSEQLTAVLAARPIVVAASGNAKRPSSFTFRALTKPRLALAKSLVRDMKAGIAGWTTVSNGNRLDYGLTQFAVDKLYQMQVAGKSRFEIGNWLGVQLDRAVREQEAAAHRAGNGKRRVQFA